MLCFLVLAHQDPVHVRRLVARLAPHDVYVHVDAKTELTDEWRAIGAPLVTPRVPVYWGGASAVDATLELLRRAMGSGRTYSHVVLISGSCYPIKDVARLSDRLLAEPDLNHARFIAADEGPELVDMVRGRYHRDGLLPARAAARRPRLARAERVMRAALHVVQKPLGLRPWPFPFAAFQGSSYWCLTGECAAWVLDYSESPQGRALRTYMRQSSSPDELFFPTVLAASPFADRLTGQIPYRRFGTAYTANLHVIHPSLGKWYTASDLDELLASDRFFVRKVSTAMSTPLLDALDAAAG